MTAHLRDDAAREIERHARETAPAECCGLLLGRGNDIVEAIPVRNVAADPIRQYEIEPREHFHVIRQARLRQLEVIGAYHSHPRSEPRPSPTDAAQAFADFLFVIAGPATGPTKLTAWQFVDGNFEPVALVRTA